MLRAESVSVVHRSRFGDVRAVKDASLHCAAGTVTTLRGPSGSGKSSLFSVMSGLIAPSEGRVLVDGQDLCGLSEPERTALRRQTIAVIFQAYNLLPTLSAFENVVYGLRRDGVPDCNDRAIAAMQHLKVEHRARLRPSMLSGGEQQRVAVARALAMRPKILLADEPTGALDVENAEHVMTTLRKIADDGAAVFVISHDPEVGRYADTILELDNGCIRDVDHSPASSSGGRPCLRPLDGAGRDQPDHVEEPKRCGVLSGTVVASGQ